MNICQFNNVLYKGNINCDFYFFCLKRDRKLIRFLFINLWYYILSYLFVSKRDIYIKKKFKYLNYVVNLDKVILDFSKEKQINNYFAIKPDLIIDNVPRIFIKNFFEETKVIGYGLDNNYEVQLEKFNKDISMISEANNLYLASMRGYKIINSKHFYLVRNRTCRYFKKRFYFRDKTLKLITLLMMAIIITCFSFFFTNSYLDLNIFFSYFEIKLFMLNLLPIFLFLLFFFLISKKIHISWLITSTLILILGVANQTKVFCRDDVVKFEDLKLFREAIIMAEENIIVIKSYTILFILIIILGYFISRRFIKKLIIEKNKRYISVILLIVLCILSYQNCYTNLDIYNSVGDDSLINVWISTRQSQIRGLVYPFIYSIEESRLKTPDGYEEEKVMGILSKYKYQDIPNNKKVNIIAIMLEAYNDFSKFEEIKFNEDIYYYLHQIQSKSISGNLVTNIFGGGTINTERQFLTGYNILGNFRGKTDSYIWYFKEQGYKTEAMHPIYGAFYNRASINPNLGFDVYYNYENKFSNIETETVFVEDDLFFDSIIAGYEKSKKDKVPYFNFSVTYQNHLPYDTNYYDGKEYYFDNDIGLDEISYNLINQYFSGIKKTNQALNKLIEYFDNEQEPVIVIFFGDHNPALGDNASVYHDLGINIDLDNLSGFLNYYETPYVIFANDLAKCVFSNEFIGSGDIISPIFLMNELFENMGLTGNEYLQYMSNLKKKVDVISTLYYKEDDVFVNINNSKYNKLIDEYNWVNYYKLNN